VAACRLGEEAVSALCERYGISRKTGYKWLSRYAEGGAAALDDRKSGPKEPQPRLAEPVVRQVLALRRARPSWGPRKLLASLAMDDPGFQAPAASSVGALLRREGLVQPRTRRGRRGQSHDPLPDPQAANDSWAADFKGWFRTGDGVRCEPLTVTDGYSRYLLVCQAVPRLDFECVRPILERSFREHGMPRALRTDNGSPFASRRGLARLTRLSVWLLGLGIWPDRIRPGRPDQNGRHERMHRTLAEEPANPPAPTLALQQARLDAWRHDYNHRRPHEALGQVPPARLWQPSPRRYPERLRPWEYPADHVVRRVSPDGYIRWQERRLYVSEALAGEHVALAQQDDGDWLLRFRGFDLARVDDETATLLSQASSTHTGQNRPGNLSPSLPV
jgi:transposase InsO family protein